LKQEFRNTLKTTEQRFLTLLFNDVISYWCRGKGRTNWTT